MEGRLVHLRNSADYGFTKQHITYMLFTHNRRRHRLVTRNVTDIDINDNELFQMWKMDYSIYEIQNNKGWIIFSRQFL